MSKKGIFISLLFFMLAVWVTIIDRAPMYWKNFDHVNAALHSLVNGEFPGPLSYRILIPYAEYYLIQAFSFLTLGRVDFILKVIVLFFTQYCFYRYLRNFFSENLSLGGTLLLMLFLDYSLSFFLGVNVLETSDLMNVLILTIALDCMYRKQFVAMLIVLFVGMVNRETPFFLFIPLFLACYQSKPERKWIVAGFLAMLMPYLFLKMLIQAEHGSAAMLDEMKRNIPGLDPAFTGYAIKANLRMLLFLGLPIAFSLYRFGKKPVFIKNAWWIVPPFIAVHYFVGNIIETRMWMPLSVVLIPMMLETFRLVQNEDKVSVKSE